MTSYGLFGPIHGDDHSLDNPDGWDTPDPATAYIDSLLDNSDTIRKGEA